MKIKLKYICIILLSFMGLFFFQIQIFAQKSEPVKTYPETFIIKPEISSPLVTGNGMEMVIAFLGNKKQFTIIPVTVENGNPLLYSHKTKSVFGKDRQLKVDSGDFPELARTGLHSDSALERKKRITGIPVDVITYIGRPGRFSQAGFLADDEGIISVLKGDNSLVKQMGLTHPQMAKPLYHVWNMILKEIEFGKLGRFSDIEYFFYNGVKVKMKAEGTKGWQVSIFQDEIQGKFEISVRRELTEGEKTLLKKWYPQLSDRQMSDLTNKLSCMHFSEMAPYYIMRYGFYEGHTDYRTDPIAISFIFGLRSLKKLERAFQGKLYTILTRHFIQKK